MTGATGVGNCGVVHSGVVVTGLQAGACDGVTGVVQSGVVAGKAGFWPGVVAQPGVDWAGLAQSDEAGVGVWAGVWAGVAQLGVAGAAAGGALQSGTAGIAGVDAGVGDAQLGVAGMAPPGVAAGCPHGGNGAAAPP